MADFKVGDILGFQNEFEFLVCDIIEDSYLLECLKKSDTSAWEFNKPELKNIESIDRMFIKIGESTAYKRYNHLRGLYDETRI